ncbi:hypothetical protein C2S51_025438 [Perilla frutescens var. frutescens]|nr:hypothetical protein C2S51_025438 [Perilla frutescens var. frutescens]
MFTCSKEGKTGESWQNKHKNAVARSGERNRGHTRCGCKAKMTVKKSHDKNIWVVGYFIEEHNHALATPTKVHLLNSHRNVSVTKKALIQQFSEANIPTCQQVRLFEIDAGVPSLTGCLEKDIRNHKKDVEIELFGHDAESLVQHFETEKQRNMNFYFAHETDESGIFIRCFWADCESRRSYANFGNTLVFDTTYNTNKYSMMFAPFVGVNHHRQTIIFGCGLLSDEKIESFTWLFSKFSECMSDYAPPGVIITDQDAGMSSSQRAESNHSFFKRYVHKKNSLVDFILHFNRALVHQRHEELVANHIDLNEKSRTFTSSVMEEQMVSTYTKTIFLRFQKELQQSMTYICSLISSTDTFSKYLVKRFQPEKIVHRERMLTYCISSDKISCSCRLFEFEGYPCRHMLCWMKVQQVMMLPNKYVLPRWTQKAKSITLCEPSLDFAKGQSYMTRHGALTRMTTELVDNCSLTEASSTFLMAELHKLKDKAKDFDSGGNKYNQLNESHSLKLTNNIQDPYPVRAKGCGKRLKPSKEKTISQSSRSCSICSRSGHDKRTCHNLQQMYDL